MYRCHTHVPKKILNNISKQYKGVVSVAEYLIERLKQKNINTAFVSQYETSSKLIKPLSQTADKIDKFELIFNKYEIAALYCAKTYTEYSNNMGVIINTTEFDFQDFTDVLCSSHPILSLCIYHSKPDLKEAIKNTSTIHPCFKQSCTIHNSAHFPNILEYMISLTEESPTAPVHLNISSQMLSENIILDNQHQNDLSFLEQCYEKDSQVHLSPSKNPPLL